MLVMKVSNKIEFKFVEGERERERDKSEDYVLES